MSLAASVATRVNWLRNTPVGIMPKDQDFQRVGGSFNSIKRKDYSRCTSSTRNGQIFTGISAWRGFCGGGQSWPVRAATISGFVTDQGRFVDRDEAARIARSQGRKGLELMRDYVRKKYNRVCVRLPNRTCVTYGNSVASIPPKLWPMRAATPSCATT